jgi:hypothetical protein
MEAAKRMDGKITEAEASAIIEEAATTRKHLSADNLARWLGITYDQRQKLRLTTIGSTNVKKADRKEIRRVRDKVKRRQKRRAAGVRPRSEYEANSLSRSQPWRTMGMSRAAWYRRKNKTATRSETSVSAAIFLSTEDRPVSTGLAEGSSTLRKESKELPSSQTAYMPAVDRYQSLPVELRLLALGGLPLPEEMRMVA